MIKSSSKNFSQITQRPYSPSTGCSSIQSLKEHGSLQLDYFPKESLTNTDENVTLAPSCSDYCLAYANCVFGNVQITETLLLKAHQLRLLKCRMSIYLNIIGYQVASCKDLIINKHSQLNTHTQLFL